MDLGLFLRGPSDASSNLTQPHDEASSDAKDAKVARAFR